MGYAADARKHVAWDQQVGAATTPGTGRTVRLSTIDVSEFVALTFDVTAVHTDAIWVWSVPMLV